RRRRRVPARRRRSERTTELRPAEVSAFASVTSLGLVGSARSRGGLSAPQFSTPRPPLSRGRLAHKLVRSSKCSRAQPMTLPITDQRVSEPWHTSSYKRREDPIPNPAGRKDKGPGV